MVDDKSLPVPPGELTSAYPELATWSILTCYRGSIAHGTYVPNQYDDLDILCIVVPPIDYYFGLKQYGSRGTKEIKYGEWDILVYEAHKFIRLLQQGNPNVLHCLWTDKKYYLKITAAGQLLLAHPYIFSGKHVYRSFVGYARAQMEKMYKGKSNRANVKRRALIGRYGYDCKNAAHMIRLLRMGIEFLSTGEMVVQRPDAREIIAIKNGKWTLDEVNVEAERLYGMIDEAMDKSKLPDGPNKLYINQLAVDVIKTALQERKEL